MSGKLSPLQQSVGRKPKPKSLDERYFETVLMGFAAVLLVPIVCVLAVLAIPFWIVGLIVRRYT